MSCVPVADDGDETCANCGTTASDTVKLKNCTACLLVKYCGVDCQKNHRKQHKKACKERAAELVDERLYSQGHERQEGDFCPICTLPVPSPISKNARFKACCMKMVCVGCVLASGKRGMNEVCAFCRTPKPYGDAAKLAQVKARVGKKDPEAIKFLGDINFHGLIGQAKDMKRAVELWTEAAGLGSVNALFMVGCSYHYGYGTARDIKRAVRFYEKAAMLGNSMARHALGDFELNHRGNYDRAARHFLISAKMGHEESLNKIKSMFTQGHANKTQYAEALTGYQDALVEMNSPEREEYKIFCEIHGHIL